MEITATSSRPKTDLRQISIFLVSIFLTFVLHEKAFGTLLCENLFSSVNQSLTSNLRLNRSLTIANKKWKEIFSVVDTYSKFIDLMNDISSRQAALATSDLMALQNIDLISVVKRMPSMDVAKLRNFVDKLSQSSLNQRNRTQIGHWLDSLSFYFHPEKFSELIKKIKPISKNKISLQEAFSGYLGLWTMNRTLITALAEVPDTMRLEILKDLKKEIANISLDSELMTMQQDTLLVPYVRTYRRNLEIMIFLILRPEIERLKNRLGSSADLKSISVALEIYFATLNEVYLPKRGGYSVQKILNTAKILQQHFVKHLKRDSEFIDLYGSFPNGKAAFKTSDIDIKFSDDFLARLTNKTKKQISEEPFSFFFSDMVARNSSQLSSEFLEFWSSYQLAERSLSENIFNRKLAKPSELLTTLYPPRSYSNDTLDFRWYNPIVVRIFRNRIAIQIVDLLESNPQYFQVELPIANRP